MNDQKIALLGASGHIGKNIIQHLSTKKNYELILFSRNKRKLQYTIKNCFPNKNFNILDYENFDKSYYDIIINCIGMSDPKDLQLNENIIYELSEHYEKIVLGYLENSPDTLYINMSSGIVYEENFTSPVDQSTNINELKSTKPPHPYVVAKRKAEINHRKLPDKNIIDLRIFNFFSRYIDLNADFFMSHVVSSLKNKKKFLTNNIDFKRDFIHPLDFGDLIEKCVIKHNLNSGFDVYSKKPISKFEILDLLYEKYHLNFEINDASISVSPTGLKKNYFSNSRKALEIGYKPNYTSLETIVTEIQFCL